MAYLRNLLGVALVLLLAACGGGGVGGGGSSTGNTGSGGGVNSGGSSSDPTGQVSITATGPSAPVGSGSQAQFDLTVRNDATGAASDVTAKLEFGNGLALASITCTAASGAACPADAASMSVSNLPAGGSLHFVVLATVTPGSSGDLSAKASVSANGAPATAAEQVAMSVQSFSADIQVRAQAPVDTSTSGGTVTYTMIVVNAGPDASSNLALQGSVDARQALGTIACVADGGAACPSTLGANMVVPTLPAGGRLVLTMPATIAANAIGPITGTLYASSQGDPLPSNNTATATATTALDSHGPTSFITLQSDAGEAIGGGQTFAFSSANAQLAVTAIGGRLHVEISGDALWSADFAEPAALSVLQAGSHQNLTRYPYDDAAVGGIDVAGNGHSCNTETGSFVIDDVTYVGASLKSVDLRFEQHCEGAAPALRGQIHWVASDSSQAPGPVYPPPASLWHAPDGATPATGNYVYLQSDPGDTVGGGATMLYTPSNATLLPMLSGLTLSVSVSGDDHLGGEFQAMDGLGQLQPGYYGNVQRYELHNPATGGMAWYGNAYNCDTLTGWFTIDNLTLSGGSIVSVDLRFEQHCNGAGPALHGQMHWVASGGNQAPGPQNPPPASLWRAPAEYIPATGNYVYLQSDPGDTVGEGYTFVYTQANARLVPTVSGGYLGFSVTENIIWGGDFWVMDAISQPQAGYYPNVRRSGSHDPAIGGMNWSIAGAGCDTLTGWFAIDNITIIDGAVTALDMRFEQRCGGGSAALHGQIHWVAGDPTAPAGPITPPPDRLWHAPTGATPPTGSYVYLQSDQGDFIGQGLTRQYTKADAVLSFTTTGAHLRLGVNGDDSWTGEFQGMSSIAQLQPGYYPGVLRYPFNNPTTGGLAWSGNGRGCNELSGWFVIDDITYTAGAVTSVDLRFEQHCEFAGPALHGQVHWVASDPTVPRGPQNPPPATLWSPPPGSTPANGNYVYLQSDTGDWIGQGATTLLYTAADEIELFAMTRGATVEVAGWIGEFLGMNSIDQLQPGYYPDLRRYPANNPTKGGLTWFGNGAGCNTVTGWFAIDSITYSADAIASLDLRFEQHCDGDAPALHGKVHWGANASSLALQHARRFTDAPRPVLSAIRAHTASRSHGTVERPGAAPPGSGDPARR